MANPTSQDNDPRGNNAENHPLSNEPQDDARNDPQNDAQNASTVCNAPQRQDSTSEFEHCFTNILPFQTSVMSNLNRLDFKNLQLAGIKTPVSQQIQAKYLIPSKCDEKLGTPRFDRGPCSNTTQTIREIKTCQGTHRDGSRWGEGPQKWIELKANLYKHVHRSRRMIRGGNEGAHFDSFNVCLPCHDRNRRHRCPYQNATITTFHSPLCRAHCLEYIAQRPYNSCHCEMFLEEEFWRCDRCARNTFQELSHRAQFYGGAIGTLNPGWEIRRKCPIQDCTRPALALCVGTTDVACAALAMPFSHLPRT